VNKARIQVGPTLDAKLVKLARDDARRFNKCFDGIIDTGLRILFTKKAPEREQWYQNLPGKTRGRKVYL
jgi:hypothetical protein